MKNEHLTELIIASIKHKAFRNMLYGKLQRCPLAEMLTEDFTAGNLQIQHSMKRNKKKTEKIDAMKKNKGQICES